MDLRISPFPADTQLRKREFAFLRNEKFKKKTTQHKGKKKSKTQTSSAETTRQEFLIFFFLKMLRMGPGCQSTAQPGWKELPRQHIAQNLRFFPYFFA